jgi:hypothetical protein
LKSDATSQANRLAEWSVFWHHPNGKCMGDVGWTATPPMDTSVSKAKFTLPAAGSEDPPRDELGTVVSTETTTVANTACSGCTIKTTVSTFENGWQLVMTQYIKADGKITNTTYQYLPPPPGPGAGDGGLGQSMSTPNTVTGYQQTRNTGKLGRITWHELFRQ